MTYKMALNVSVKNKSCSYRERGLYLDLTIKSFLSGRSYISGSKCSLELCNFSASFTFTAELPRALGNGNVSIPENLVMTSARIERQPSVQTFREKHRRHFQSPSPQSSIVFSTDLC